MARRFRFNLQPVLRYREIMEDQRRREFAEANRAAESERLRREGIREEHEETLTDIVKMYSENAPFQSIVNYYHHAGALEGDMAESLRKQQQLDNAVELRRQNMVLARQQTKIMESLREARKVEFEYEQERKDQTLLDELAVQARSRAIRDTQGEEE